jgi:hypothetical protein
LDPAHSGVARIESMTGSEAKASGLEVGAHSIQCGCSQTHVLEDVIMGAGVLLDRPGSRVSRTG